MPKGSPFPGMDPWLEKHWESLHHSYIQFARGQIAGQLPEGLFTEVEETVYIMDADALAGSVRPDVAMFNAASDAAVQDAAEDELPAVAGRTAVAKPVRVQLTAEPVALTHLVIRSLSGGEPLVTAIQVISPTNKVQPKGRRQYRRKRQSYYDARVNLVEIDLLRAGR